MVSVTQPSHGHRPDKGAFHRIRVQPLSGALGAAISGVDLSRPLFVNRAFTLHFEGMTAQESRPLLEFLYAHAVRPEFTGRFRWRRNSIAFWDNRCVMHYAVNDYPDERRYMHRVTINGDRPV